MKPTALPLNTPRFCAGRGALRGFSITELLVVIAIIVVLAGLLLVALSSVQDRAKSVRTQSRMTAFSQSCEAFQLANGYYPGAVPEEILANNPQISGTENALLHLMGGVVREEDFTNASDFNTWDNYGKDAPGDWVVITFNRPGGGTYRIKVNARRIGEGPIIDGKPQEPFFTPGPNELGLVNGQLRNGRPEPALTGSELNRRLPDLLDAWGQPIAFIKRNRETGELVSGSVDSIGFNAQFYFGGMAPYVGSTALGDAGEDQTKLSILNFNVAPNVANNLAQIIRHPAFGDNSQPELWTPRGAYVLFSAGKDGVFFSQQDGPGEPSNPVNDLSNLDPEVVQEYDDVVVFGGG
jgi:prepilin-type N-terminal cleavage/methylation domain-containing protein